MNKKQVGALLKVMSKDDMRPVLCAGYVDRYDGELHLVATDGYALAAIKLDADAVELEGKLIRRSAIEKWYKLATGKSRLTSEELVEISRDDYAQHGNYMDGNYPKWQALVPSGEPQGQTSMYFNAELVKIAQDLDGAGAVKVELYGKLSPMVIRSENGLYLAMPMKA